MQKKFPRGKERGVEGETNGGQVDWMREEGGKWKASRGWAEGEQAEGEQSR